MIHTKRFASFLNVKVENNIECIVFKNLTLTNKSEYFDKLFIPQELKFVLGLNEVQSIIDNNLLLYCEEDFDVHADIFSERNCLIAFLLMSEFFCQALWLIKDNSAQFELGHLIFESEVNQSVHSNFWHSAYTTSIGTTTPTEFTLEEINAAIQLFPLVIAIHFVGEGKNHESVKVTSTISRLARAFYFLQSARNSEEIGTKLSLYCSVFESLFSVSNNELRHRLAEAVSFFLSDDKTERLRIYKVLQTAYDIRSSVVHGDGIQSKFLKDNYKLLMDNVVATDEVLRTCINKIISNQNLYELFTEKSKDDVSDYIQSLIFE